MDSPLSLAPPLIAIALAIGTRQVYLSLFVGIWLGWTILSGMNPLVGLGAALDGCVATFKDPGDAKVILFSALIGGLIRLTEVSGGVSGFVRWVTDRGWVRSARGAGLLGWALGCLIFIESSITSLVTGAVIKPLADRFGMSRAKLAYICDATSAPICMLIPLNAWGAYTLRLVSEQGGADPLGLLVRGVLLDFYAIIAIILVPLLLHPRFEFGPMRRVEGEARSGADPSRIAEAPIELGDRPQRARNMVVPLAVMVLTMPLGLYATGRAAGATGSLTAVMSAGSGSTSVFWAVLLAIVTAVVLYLGQRLMRLPEATDETLRGAGDFIGLALLMILAFALGAVCKELGTGRYVANLAAGALSPWSIAPLIFLAAGATAFATGTSWGTFAIFIPIALPAAVALGASPALCLGAVLSGGVFGDHASPLSDTTIVASLAAGCDPITHVRTQLPYALVGAAISTALFGLVGVILR